MDKRWPTNPQSPKQTDKYLIKYLEETISKPPIEPLPPSASEKINYFQEIETIEECRYLQEIFAQAKQSHSCMHDLKSKYERVLKDLKEIKQEASDQNVIDTVSECICIIEDMQTHLKALQDCGEVLVDNLKNCDKVDETLDEKAKFTLNDIDKWFPKKIKKKEIKFF